MMVGIFVLLLIGIIMVLIDKHTPAKVFLLLSFIVSCAMFIHHVTNHINIQL
jgi:hypothetical protein